MKNRTFSYNKHSSEMSELHNSHFCTFFSSCYFPPKRHLTKCFLCPFQSASVTVHIIDGESNTSSSPHVVIYRAVLTYFCGKTRVFYGRSKCHKVKGRRKSLIRFLSSAGTAFKSLSTPSLCLKSLKRAFRGKKERQRQNERNLGKIWGEREGWRPASLFSAKTI